MINDLQILSVVKQLCDMLPAQFRKIKVIVKYFRLIKSSIVLKIDNAEIWFEVCRANRFKT